MTPENWHRVISLINSCLADADLVAHISMMALRSLRCNLLVIAENALKMA